MTENNNLQDPVYIRNKLNQMDVDLALEWSKIFQEGDSEEHEAKIKELQDERDKLENLLDK